MNIAIIDNEQEYIDALVSIIHNYKSTNSIDISIDTFTNGKEFIASYHPYAYSAFFLDIYMNDINGVDIANDIRLIDKNVIIIFLTSSQDHLREAFKLHAYDYIEKPASRDYVIKVLDDIISSTVTDSKSLSFISNREHINIRLHDLISIQTEGRNIRVTAVDGSTYLTRKTFGELSSILQDDPRFLLLIRGVIVNMDYVIDIYKDTCELTGGLLVPINIRNGKMLKQTWANYKMSKIREDRRRKRELGS